MLFLEHNVCFRETDPLRMEPYLVFPELINLKKPPEDEQATEDGVAYTVSGPTENVFASLVVLLGYTHTFTRTAQWQNNARYEVGDRLVCGFRQEAERDGELDFVLCFGPDGRPAGAGAVSGAVREFPGPAELDGAALRTGALHQGMRPLAGPFGRAPTVEGGKDLRFL